MNSRYIVVMLGDRQSGCQCGCSEPEYVLACRNAWTNREDAERYADACSRSRLPLVVECPRGVEFRTVEEEPKPQVQTRGPQCKNCGAFTTKKRVETIGLCMRCENEVTP